MSASTSPAVKVSKMAATMLQGAKKSPRLAFLQSSQSTEKKNKTTPLDEKEKSIKSSLHKFWKSIVQQGSFSDLHVKELLNVEWNSLEESVLKEYKTFLLHIITSNAYYLKAVLAMLIRNFLPTVEEDAVVHNTAQIGKIKATDESKFDQIHLLLQDIISLVPLCPVVIISLLSENFPYLTRESYVQACYVRNLLRVTEYLPSERRTILEIIVNHLTKLDVHCPKHELLTFTDDARYENMDLNMELDECEGRMPAEIKAGLAHPYGNSLDTLMDIVFQYIHNVCFLKGNLNWSATKLLYQDLLYIFDKLILPTHACCHVQFMMFFICSFKLTMADSFLKHLWKKMEDPNTPMILRQAAVAYISSFLARSSYIPLTTITNSLNTLSEWVHHYIDSDGGGSCTAVDIMHHGHFYSVCQAVFYVFAFRHKELVEMPNGYLFLRNLNLQRMITCRLNPLKVCLPTVVQNFASVARNYQLAYCYTIIERNQRASLPVISYSANRTFQMTNLNPLDSFYPFDPYVLPRSNLFIAPIFNKYQVEVEEKSEVSDTEEDDFLEASLMIPDFASAALPDFFVYSTSPGFKDSPS